jgi:hypothetical protein
MGILPPSGNKAKVPRAKTPPPTQLPPPGPLLIGHISFILRQYKVRARELMRI